MSRKPRVRLFSGVRECLRTACQPQRCFGCYGKQLVFESEKQFQQRLFNGDSPLWERTQGWWWRHDMENVALLFTIMEVSSWDGECSPECFQYTFCSCVFVSLKYNLYSIFEVDAFHATPVMIDCDELRVSTSQVLRCISNLRLFVRVLIRINLTELSHSAYA